MPLNDEEHTATGSEKGSPTPEVATRFPKAQFRVGFVKCTSPSGKTLWPDDYDPKTIEKKDDKKARKVVGRAPPTRANRG